MCFYEVSHSVNMYCPKYVGIMMVLGLEIIYGMRGTGSAEVRIA